MSGPRYLEEGRAEDVAPSTLKQYRSACGKFLLFLRQEGFVPEEADEWDDLLVEWSFVEHISPATLRLAMAGLEFLFIRLRGKLVWAKKRLDSKVRMCPPHHTHPAGRETCRLLGAQLASRGRARLGLMLMIQCKLGLRPGEILALTPSDVSVSPEDRSRHIAVFRLGFRRGTKAGREQFALFDIDSDQLLWRVFTIAIMLTDPGDRIFPFSLSTVSSWLKKVQADLLLTELLITPHSPRVGFCSDAVADGRPAPEIKEAGRWISEASFRLYLDVVGSLHVAQALRLKGFGEAISWIGQNLESYFNEVTLDCYARGSGEVFGRAVAGRVARGRGAGSRGRGGGRRRVGLGRGAGRGRPAAAAVDR